jgi:zinc transport system ATP-binding protein
MSNSIISIKDVSFSYAGPTILEGINLEVEEGEFLGVVGPNAGGKSTLLKLILGLLEPVSGTVEVLGYEPRSASPKIGYVPQHPQFGRDFPITVEQVVLMGCLGSSSWFGGYSRQDRWVAHRAMVETEVEGLAKRQISTLSGGQLQRVLVARALACDPRILILDEPTANIDMRVESDIFDLLKHLNQRMTIILVSHDVGFISQYVNRVACLNQTMVCHETACINGKVIDELYGSHVHMVEHVHN